MLWHYESTDGEQVSVEWVELRRLMAAGVITPTTRLRRDDQNRWRTAGDTELRPFLQAAEPRLSEVSAPPSTGTSAAPLFPRVLLAEGRSYGHLSQLVEFVYVLIGIVELIVSWLAWQHVRLVSQIVSGDRWQARSAALQLSSEQGPVWLVLGIEIAASLLGILLFLRWLYRSGRNLRELGAEGLRYGPGWLVGCYFVPVVNLWKPYRAMEEVWQASAHPLDWEKHSAPRSIGVWWTALVVSGLSGQLAVLLTRLVDTPEGLVFPAYASLVSGLANVLVAFMTARLVRQITRLQTGGEE